LTLIFPFTEIMIIPTSLSILDLER